MIVLKFIVAHARSFHPSRRGLWFVHEHSARLCKDAMTAERWMREVPGMQRARDVLKWQSGPRWAVIAVAERE
jgi:hypothetical protein